MAAQRTYSPKEICQMLRISARQLGYWRLIGVVKPQKKVRGSKVFHRYSEKDLKILKEVRELTAKGYFVSKAAEQVRTRLTGGPSGKKTGMQTERRATFFELRFKEEWIRSRRFRYPLSCIVIGSVSVQEIGMSQLQGTVQLLEQIILKTKRAYDVVARTGVAEFVWLLPQTDERGAAAVVRRFRAAAQQVPIQPDQERLSREQLRIGMATALPTNHEVADLVDRAREAVTKTP